MCVLQMAMITDPAERLKARNLLLLAAHTLVKDTAATTENLTGEGTHNYYGSSATIKVAECKDN